METAEEFFEYKGVDTDQIVCYYVRDGVGDDIDFDPIEYADRYARKVVSVPRKRTQLLEAKILQWYRENGRDEKFAEFFGITSERVGKLNAPK